MSGKDVDLHYVCFSLVLSFLSLGLLTSAAGTVLLLLLVLCVFLCDYAFSSGGVFDSSSRRFLTFELLLLSLAVFTVMRIRVITKLNLGFEPSQVFQIRGRVVYDSSISSNGNHVMKIMLSGCRTLSGDYTSAGGLVSVLGKEREIISSGTVVCLDGRFSGDLFIYDKIQVMGRGFLNDIRERLIPVLQKRLLSDGDEASVLSTLLLFGRSDYAESSIKELAQNCGCSHILALSGMHLGIITATCRRLFGKRTFGKMASSVFIFAFVFVAGPRPSLVRAALTFILGMFAIKNRLFYVFLLQMVLFPESMVEPGSCYGYVAVFAIVYLSPSVHAVLFQYVGKLSRLVSASVSVMLLSAPVQIVLTGKWHPAAIAASPVAGLLAAFSMMTGLLILCFGHVPVIVRLNGWTYRALVDVFTCFGSLDSTGWAGYLVFISSIAILSIILSFAHRIMSRRCS